MVTSTRLQPALTPPTRPHRRGPAPAVITAQRTAARHRQSGTPKTDQTHTDAGMLPSDRQHQSTARQPEPAPLPGSNRSPPCASRHDRIARSQAIRTTPPPRPNPRHIEQFRGWRSPIIRPDCAPAFSAANALSTRSRSSDRKTTVTNPCHGANLGRVRPREQVVVGGGGRESNPPDGDRPSQPL